MDEKQKIFLLEKIEELTKKEISVKEICKILEISDKQLFLLLKYLRDDKKNIVTDNRADGLYLYNRGEEHLYDGTINFETNTNNEFNFVAISDLRIGSKAQQMSIINDIYLKASELGYDKVMICSNITEGVCAMQNKLFNGKFINDTYLQAKYIADNFPKIEGITTYIVTGPKDESHLKNNNVNIGMKISNLRDDFVYLGQNSVDIMIDNVFMQIYNSDKTQTYTMSYRPEQVMEAFRSENKPDFILYGGLLQKDRTSRRDIDCYTIPTVIGTTLEMKLKRQTNTVGAIYFKVKTDKKGNLEKVEQLVSPYWTTKINDYQTFKKLVLTKDWRKSDEK